MYTSISVYKHVQSATPESIKLLSSPHACSGDVLVSAWIAALPL